MEEIHEIIDLKNISIDLLQLGCCKWTLVLKKLCCEKLQEFFFLKFQECEILIKHQKGKTVIKNDDENDLLSCFQIHCLNVKNISVESVKKIISEYEDIFPNFNLLLSRVLILNYVIFSLTSGSYDNNLFESGVEEIKNNKNLPEEDENNKIFYKRPDITDFITKLYLSAAIEVGFQNPSLFLYNKNKSIRCKNIRSITEIIKNVFDYVIIDILPLSNLFNKIKKETLQKEEKIKGILKEQPNKNQIIELPRKSIIIKNDSNNFNEKFISPKLNKTNFNEEKILLTKQNIQDIIDKKLLNKNQSMISIINNKNMSDLKQEKIITKINDEKININKNLSKIDKQNSTKNKKSSQKKEKNSLKINYENEEEDEEEEDEEDEEEEDEEDEEEDKEEKRIEEKIEDEKFKEEKKKNNEDNKDKKFISLNNNKKKVSTQIEDIKNKKSIEKEKPILISKKESIKNNNKDENFSINKDENFNNNKDEKKNSLLKSNKNDKMDDKMDDKMNDIIIKNNSNNEKQKKASININKNEKSKTLKAIDVNDLNNEKKSSNKLSLIKDDNSDKIISQKIVPLIDKNPSSEEKHQDIISSANNILNNILYSNDIDKKTILKTSIKSIQTPENNERIIDGSIVFENNVNDRNSQSFNNKTKTNSGIVDNEFDNVKNFNQK